MINLIGYNFLFDKDALQRSIITMNTASTIEIYNAIYYQLNAKSTVDTICDTEPPTAWDMNTILNAMFEGNVNGGNTSYTAQELSAVKIKRRTIWNATIEDYDNTEWQTIKTIPITSSADMTFSIVDFLNQHGATYEYAFIPVLINGQEGNGIYSDVESNLNNVFVCDKDEIFIFSGNIEYGSMTQNIENDIKTTLGGMYPFEIRNGNISYATGNINGYIIDRQSLDTSQFSNLATTSYRRSFTKFLTNGNPKIIKDFNGNIRLVTLSSSPTNDFDSSVSNSISKLNFSWVEIGDYFNKQDLIDNDLIEVD